VAETAGQVTLTVKRVAGSDGPVSVDYRTEAGTATEERTMSQRRERSPGSRARPRTEPLR
jgi:hypothetical protein